LIIDSIVKEILQRKNYLDARSIDTIYFGGGTPSVLSKGEIAKILDTVRNSFSVSSNTEITLEANPDDLKREYLEDLLDLGFNRLSIGTQSFHDEDLKWMNRRHNGNEAERSIKLSQDVGFHNLNIDLIYGLPQLTSEGWSDNLNRFFSLQVPHLSAYHLTIEPKTVFGYYKRKGRLTEIDEEQSLVHYNILTKLMKENNYLHYEISNFCKEGFYSKHNTSYWKYGKYLGIGPSAHSFNGYTRQWNTRINSNYIKALNEGTAYFEEEQLSEKERFNDYILTGLRTQWGVDEEIIRLKFGETFVAHLEKELHRFIDSKHAFKVDSKIYLTEEGMFISDKIISELFWV
jgi:oxygen-independent coproporphyrinogen-3 oxidase